MRPEFYKTLLSPFWLIVLLLAVVLPPLLPSYYLHIVILTLVYVALFPSTLAYLCFNRGVQLIGANRAAPFFHVVPVFGTVMSIVFLGEHPQAFHFIGFALVLTGVFVASRKASA